MSAVRTHVPVPGALTKRKAWCGAGYSVYHAVTTSGVIDCPDCLRLLWDSPQYYNQLRQKGLRSYEEKEWERRESKRKKKAARKGKRKKASARRPKGAPRKARPRWVPAPGEGS